MTTLAQIIAIEKGVKQSSNRELTDQYHLLQRPALLSGLTRVYSADAVSDGEIAETLPSESVKVQAKVEDVLHEASITLTRLFDVTLTKDTANQSARADVVVDGETLLSDVPVTYLLFLEKQLGDLGTIIKTLPVLDPAEEWDYDSNTGVYRTEPQQTRRSKKVKKVLVRYPADDKHPAQTETYDDDVAVGTWTLTKFSGAVSADRKRQLLDRVNALSDAVKMARQSANRVDVVDQHAGKLVFDYLLAN